MTLRLLAPLLLASTLAAPDALAFCRTTTCDPNDPAEQCQKDSKQCVLTGDPLSWRSSCVTVGVQRGGSPVNGFAFDDITPVVEKAFAAWMNADCGGKTHPNIDVQMIGPIECDISEYNPKVGNANIVLFVQEDWPHIGAGDALGITTTRFDTKTGALWDADMEINGTQNLSVGDPIEGADLLSIITHEAGHFLGLSHSTESEATMRTFYNPGADGDELRSLSPDDVAGICEIYPPDRKPATTSCENRHGFSEQCGADQPPPDESKGCGCKLLNARSGSSESTGGAAAILLVLGAVVRRRVARRRPIV